MDVKSDANIYFYITVQTFELKKSVHIYSDTPAVYEKKSSGR